jgi:hypothetical protein
MILTGDTLLVSLGKEHERLGVTLWGLEKSLTVGILSNALQNRSHSTRDLVNSGSA